MAGYQCDGCRKRRTGTPRRSATGRQLCPGCADELDALAVGMIASGGVGRAATPEVTGQAIATVGWYRWLRRYRDRRAAAASRDEGRTEPG